ncbi:MAG TPA: HD domain-containing phosphohydrolase [Anaerolineales bacterium]
MGGSVYPYWPETPLPLPKMPVFVGGQKAAYRDPVPPPRDSSPVDALILVVEDNDVLRQGLRQLLENDGFQVTCASQGLEALQEMQSQTPDFILSDISMPEMDGYSFFETVRARPEWVPIPFVFLTAHAGREDVFEGRKLGAEDYLVKPVNRQELISTVRSRLARSQELKLAQVEQAYEASLIMLSNAIEQRDMYTRTHVERVKAYSMTIAYKLGLNYSQMKALHFGSILHDIGKIYIRENILKKPGRLSAEEWAEMKQHPVLGAELIQNIPYLAPAIPVVRHHHERWDGQGYPDGLVGADIPVAARVVAVADALDAMTSARTYKEAFSLTEAYAEILHCSGVRYDPAVVRAFQEVWTEIETIFTERNP